MWIGAQDKLILVSFFSNLLATPSHTPTCNTHLQYEEPVVIQVNAIGSEQSSNLFQGHFFSIELVMRAVVLEGSPGDNELAARYYFIVISRLSGGGRGRGREGEGERGARRDKKRIDKGKKLQFLEDLRLK